MQCGHLRLGLPSGPRELERARGEGGGLLGVGLDPVERRVG